MFSILLTVLILILMPTTTLAGEPLRYKPMAVSFDEGAAETIWVLGEGYSIFINGMELRMLDVDGRRIEPFAYGGNLFVPADEWPDGLAAFDLNGSVIPPFSRRGYTYIPVEAAARMMGAAVNWDSDTNSLYVDYQSERTDGVLEIHTTYRVEAARPEVIRGEVINRHIPILMYHTSSEDNPGAFSELYIKPSEFEKQLQYLNENGFTFVTFDDWDDLPYIAKPVMLTFDDGYLSNYWEIYPILQKHEARATIFIVSENINDDILSEWMVKEMSGSGYVKFESHTASHFSLTGISGNRERLFYELYYSKKRIEEVAGREVLALAYPYGAFDGRVLSAAGDIYRFGLINGLGRHSLEQNEYQIRRIRISRSTALPEFKRLVSPAGR